LADGVFDAEDPAQLHTPHASVLARIDPGLLARNDPDGKHDLRS
jgi:hypothetical protein